MIRIAAAGDLHFDIHSKGRLSNHFEYLKNNADLFVIAGDLTQTGNPAEVEVLADDLSKSPVPVFAVLGNHDHHSDKIELLLSILKSARVTVLEKSSAVLKVKEETVGISGVKGFGGGFVGACGSEFGEPEMKEFIIYTKKQAQALEKELNSLTTDYRIALLHYSPTTQTLAGERKEIYPFLGSYYLAEAVDRGKADIVFHGHAHRGVHRGETPGGTPVRNVAQHVIRHAFNVYILKKDHLKSGVADQIKAVTQMFPT